tara:strand:- start:661 stop:1299 length:639 start_codon:yes stop_codon:yes gene_type:complete
MKMLELTGIHFHPATSETPILNEVNLVARCGSPTTIEGKSGSGKTTLIEVIGGLAKPQRGLIKWCNKGLSIRQRKRLCGVVFQFPERYFLGLTIAQELRLGQIRLGTEEQMEILNKVGLSEIELREAPENLSGGQQRRLAIAVQLLKRPDILLFDEPTAGLDWSVKREIQELLIKLSTNQLVIVVTHEPDLFKDSTFSSFQLTNGELKQITK